LGPLSALTIGAIARELGEPIHRIQYAVKTRGIKPAAVAGHIRVFAPETVERVADILRDIDRQQARPTTPEPRLEDVGPGGVVE
jgi:hypothetical protein